MIRETALLLRTAKHLKWRQMYYRLHYGVKKKISGSRRLDYQKMKTPVHLEFKNHLNCRPMYDSGKFFFLNRPKRFNTFINWDFKEYGRLWNYNLNYFDFLNQENNIGRDEGLGLIKSFLDGVRLDSAGMEPYPLSLRIINWVKFLARYDSDHMVKGALYAQARVLKNNLEYHIMGNHLLENGFALFFAGCYFNCQGMYLKARDVLQQQLDEQILNDGAHFELSPMYHQLVLSRLLDVVNLLKCNPHLKQELRGFLEGKAALMLGWLNMITFANGDIPLLNDSSHGIAPTTAQLNYYAARLGVCAAPCNLKGSGYRKFEGSHYEMIADIGDIGPDYIPGHAHSDTFNFVLNANGKPLVVDTGVSTYEPGPARNYQRSTAAHNTVTVDGRGQSEMWGSFRVGRRARVCEVNETGNFFSATHNGFLLNGALHTRGFDCRDKKLTIRDSISSSKDHSCRAYLHFHPDAALSLEGNKIIANGVVIKFTGGVAHRLERYEYAPEFNKTVKAQMAAIDFRKKLQTEFFF